MKRILTLLLVFVSVLQVVAQSGSIGGQALSKIDSKPIDFATVTLLNAANSKVITGAMTDAQGKFLLNKLAPGTYHVQVQFLGFEVCKVQNISLSRGQDLKLPTILLAPSQMLLQEITVTGEKAAVYHQIDKQVYSAAQFQTATGGTGVDVLKNLPSISVDAQGQINMRGSTGFTVFLNGKPVQSDAAALLSQIPANAIENVEVVTAPSAKYDPDGKAGIINITTKKGADNGYSVLVNMQGGLPSIEPYGNAESAKRYGGDATVSFRKDKWDVSVGGSYVRNDIAGRRVGDVNTTIGNRRTSFPSVDERSFDKYNRSLRATVIFALDERNTFQTGFYYGNRTEYRLADINYNNTTTNASTKEVIGRSQYFNSNLVKKSGDFSIANLDYTHKFRNSATLSLSGLVERDKLSGYTKNLNLHSQDVRDTLQYTENTNERPLNGLRLRTDFATKLGAGKLESGYQYRHHNDDGQFVYKQKDQGASNYVFYPEFSGNVNLTNEIHSVYTQYSGKVAKLEYAAGLRYEYAARDFTIRENTYELNLSNFFPSANVFYSLNDNWKAKAGYSRRVQRSSSFELNPLPEREHSETLEQGDPELLPEFVNLSEAGLVRNFEKGSVFATFYHQDIKNVINRVNNVYADTVLGRIYTNAGRASRLGLEVGFDYKPTHWWKFYLGGNVYDYNIKGSLFDNTVTVNNGSLVYSINANSSFNLSSTTTLQGTFNYLSERATAQGEDSRFYNPSLALRKTFLDGKLAATLQWQNIDMGLLNSNEQRITTRGRDFYTTTNYIYEVDVIMLNLSFNLNKLGKKVKFTESEFGEKEF
ncbi:TonB-dependent receptor [Rufibacter radiotolerans]|uniref:TonB-dependent receptor n=1 Tax=Rufibacter radiotolerans TaxID=1379910 RepID=A0A0H4VR11_9BACT|nr:TonB-dependent receptor [Rufibacter radiotolerans]AKQ46174.1 TonB-dependent receptor [Rufibacter radiotolerans]